jgi:D-glycero-beta-D-manno-heptose 1-phosphate adenylyltransferase
VPEGLSPPGFEAKICSPAALTQRCQSLPRPLVFTNGVFDILHRGHVTYLSRARDLGAALVLALNADASVKKLGKGDDRPINTLEDRLAIAASLACVDVVTWFEEDTPLQTIQLVLPDILVKGGDWPVDQIVGNQLVWERGGKVHAIPFEHERSTSALLKKIRC